MNIKRRLTAIMLVVLMLTMCACSKKDANNSSENANVNGTVSSASDSTLPDSSAAETQETQPEAAQTSEPEEVIPAEPSLDYPAVSIEESIPEGFVLVWNDEFDGDSLDLTKWSYQYGTGDLYGLNHWGNSEQQYYTDDEKNVSVSDGTLKITALKENYKGNAYTSGRIRTITDDGNVLFAPTFGRIEARMKIAGGPGVWPAFWLLPVDLSTYGAWAASGEIDIMEAMGRVPERVGGTIHYGQSWPNNTYSNNEFYFPEGEDIHGYHTYALDWAPDHMSWYVDDRCYATIENWFAKCVGEISAQSAPAPFDVPFYIILNLAMGGTYDPAAIIRDSSFPAQMEVDYVRVYQLEEGYDALVKEVAGTRGAVSDPDQVKNVAPGGNMLWNGTLSLGQNHTAYWNFNGITTDFEPSDLSKKLIISTDETEDCSMIQRNLILEGEARYGVRFDIGSEAETEVTVIIRSGDTVICEETVSIEIAERKIYGFTYETAEGYENVDFELHFEPESHMTIDNILMMRIG